MNKLILASASPRRKELLEDAGINIEVFAPLNESAPYEREKPWEYVKRVSYEKLHEIESKKPEARYILAADTIVVIDNKILGKPKDKDEWKRFLKILSGRWHKVYTGYALKCHKKIYRRSIKSKILFNNLDERTINFYISTEEGLDKAGGYAVQGKGKVLIKEIRGSLTNIIGLPVSEVLNDLKKCTFF